MKTVIQNDIKSIIKVVNQKDESFFFIPLVTIGQDIRFKDSNTRNWLINHLFFSLGIINIVAICFAKVSVCAAPKKSFVCFRIYSSSVYSNFYNECRLKRKWKTVFIFIRNIF